MTPAPLPAAPPPAGSPAGQLLCSANIPAGGPARRASRFLAFGEDIFRAKKELRGRSGSTVQAGTPMTVSETVSEEGASSRLRGGAFLRHVAGEVV